MTTGAGSISSQWAEDPKKNLRNGHGFWWLGWLVAWPNKRISVVSLVSIGAPEIHQICLSMRCQKSRDGLGLGAVVYPDMNPFETDFI